MHLCKSSYQSQSQSEKIHLVLLVLGSKLVAIHQTRQVGRSYRELASEFGFQVDAQLTDIAPQRKVAWYRVEVE